MKRIGIIYQYHLDAPLNDRKPSRHYTGFCESGRLAERDATHHKGVRHAHNQNGELVATGAARFLQVAVERGIGFHLVRTWRGTRDDERRLKRNGHAADMCPLCRARPRQITFIDEIAVETALTMKKTRGSDERY